MNFDVHDRRRLGCVGLGAVEDDSGDDWETL